MNIETLYLCYQSNFKYYENKEVYTAAYRHN